MRVLHTADWHLGRSLEGRNRSTEQEEFAAEICDIAKDQDVDMVVIAGDVFDTSNPAAASEDLFYDTLDRLADGGRRALLVLAGNHDNPERLCAATPLARRHGIALVGRPGEEIISGGDPGSARFLPLCPGVAAVNVPHCDHEILVIALPYPSEARLRDLLDTSERTDEDLQQAYASRLSAILRKCAERITAERPALIASHLLVMGGTDSESERPLTVGGAYSVPASILGCGPQYVALGHLHRPQSIGGSGEIIRYAGSPLAYSFSEAGHAKSVSLVDMVPGMQPGLREIHLSCGRPLVKWTATQGISQVKAWCDQDRDPRAWIDLEIHMPDALTHEEIARLRRMHPGFIHIRPVYPEMQVLQQQARASVPLPDLFRQFYMRKKGVVPTDALVRLFLQLVDFGAGAPSTDGGDAR